MARAVFSSFLLAGVLILTAAFYFAPQAGAEKANGCNNAYGIDGCAAASAPPVR